MPSDDSSRTVTLTCQKTGREYDAEVTEADGVARLEAECPYCDNRGAGAVVDDIRQRIDDVEKHATEGDDDAE